MKDKELEFKLNNEIKRINSIILYYVSIFLSVIFFILLFGDIFLRKYLNKDIIGILILMHLTFFIPHFFIFLFKKKIKYYFFYISIISIAVAGFLALYLDITFRSSIEGYTLIIIGLNAIYLFKPIYSVLLSMTIYIILLVFLYLFKTETLQIVPLLLNGFIVAGIGILIDVAKYPPMKNAFIRKIKYMKVREELKQKNKIIEEHLKKIKKEEAIKEEMFSQITHELNTPLTIFFGNFEKVSKDEYVQKKYKKNIDSVSRNLLRIKANINKIFTLLRVDFDTENDTVPEEISIGEILKDLKNDYEELMKEDNIEFIIHNEECQTNIQMSKLDLNIILGNLIENSKKFSSPPLKIEVGCENDGKYLGIYVKDDGIGMGEELKARIFKKFSQGESSVKIKGMGLGLYIVKKLVDKYHGKLDVESELGSGTKITFYIKSQQNS